MPINAGGGGGGMGGGAAAAGGGKFVPPYVRKALEAQGGGGPGEGEAEGPLSARTLEILRLGEGGGLGGGGLSWLDGPGRPPGSCLPHGCPGPAHAAPLAAHRVARMPRCCPCLPNPPPACLPGWPAALPLWHSPGRAAARGAGQAGPAADRECVQRGHGQRRPAGCVWLAWLAWLRGRAGCAMQAGRLAAGSARTPLGARTPGVHQSHTPALPLPRPPRHQTGATLRGSRRPRT